jgi:uncharacterized FlaG/YvyC family protein
MSGDISMNVQSVLPIDSTVASSPGIAAGRQFSSTATTTFTQAAVQYSQPSAQEQKDAASAQLPTLRPTTVEFQFDKDTSEVVVKMIDQDSGTVIYQFPSNVALDIAKHFSTPGHTFVNRTV